MAPLDLNNTVNVASLAGTWMGTLFTGVGLLAVLTQLRNLLLYASSENRQWKERAAGAWASCILVDRLPNNGIQEGVVPIFSGWLQHFYLQHKTVTVSQDDRGVSGKSSWSNLFSRMDIQAADLDAYGGLERQPAPTEKYNVMSHSQWIRELRPGLGDALVENGSISYGFSAPEFAALIILCGFRPGDFAPQSSRHSKSHYGQMLVAEYGQFSQVAKFDSHHGFRDTPRSFRTDMCEVPVAHSLNLAFGMIRVSGRRGREWVIPREWTSPSDIHNRMSSTQVWSGYASPQQLEKIQYSFERFVGTSELAIGEYSQRNDAFEADDIEVLEDVMSSSRLLLVTQSSNDDFAARVRGVLSATHAIAAIQPWALPPVLPAHMVVAVKMILEPFYRTREFTANRLQHELKVIPNRTFRPQGRTGEELFHQLSLIVGNKVGFFGAGKHSVLTSIYHESMSLVFHHKNIKFEDVRMSLAAAVGSSLLADRAGAREVAEGLEHFQEDMRQYLERCYLQAIPRRKSRNVPAWAIDVYANYLWGWITDSIPADPDLVSYFRRRVFLA
ncbi:MAG: hypothetical protein Q9175_007442 [Cornicularia normoerica]